MSYTHLTARDRYVISHLNEQLSYREIARRLGRHHTTISREIKRNKPPHSTYWYYFIERDVERKRRTARCFRRQSYLPLVEYVEDKLMLDWPPEAISARLKLEYPHDERMRVNHETIYRWIYLDAMEGVLIKIKLHTSIGPKINIVINVWNRFFHRRYPFILPILVEKRNSTASPVGETLEIYPTR